MEQDKSGLLNFAMYAGIFLGGFWILKYLFVIAGFKHPAMNVLGMMLSVGTPLLLFYFLTKYNAALPEKKMSYWHGVQFSIILFFFASVFEAIAVFIHVKWIDPVFIENLYENMVEVAKTLNFSPALVERILEQPMPSPFMYVFSNVIMADVFLGLLLSLFIVPIAMRYKSAQNL